MKGDVYMQKKWWCSLLVFIALVSFLHNHAAAATTKYQVEINKTTNKLILFKDGVVYKKYRVATGRTKKLTPEGTFTMVVKVNKPSWKGIPGGSPKNPLGEKWMGLSVNGDRGRTYGIHGTNQPSSIGKHITHGCIRMAKKNLLELYHTINEGTPVWIHRGKSTGEWKGDPSEGIQSTTGKIRVTATIANVRTGPSLGSFVIKKERFGAVLELIGFVQDWYQVELENGRIGFIHNSVVEVERDKHNNTVK